jgi:hypothetical protein
MVFNLMGVSILVAWVATGVLALVLVGQRLEDRVAGAAGRIGDPAGRGHAGGGWGAAGGGGDGRRHRGRRTPPSTLHQEPGWWPVTWEVCAASRCGGAGHHGHAARQAGPRGSLRAGPGRHQRRRGGLARATRYWRSSAPPRQPRPPMPAGACAYGRSPHVRRALTVTDIRMAVYRLYATKRGSDLAALRLGESVLHGAVQQP